MRNEDAGPGAGFVYMQTNEPERNRLLAFRRRRRNADARGRL